MMRRRLPVFSAIVLFAIGVVYCHADGNQSASEQEIPATPNQPAIQRDTLAKCSTDSLEDCTKTPFGQILPEDSTTRYATLTEADFKKVADELGVEIAAMKAVVQIEAGAAMEGFLAPGVPVINFDRSMYNWSLKRVKNIRKAPASEKVPEGIKSSYGRKEWTQLVAARKKNLDAANMGTFWGMFQIGGFNYKICGCETVDQFVERMSYSELEQLELFAIFLVNTGMVKALRDKNWKSFARQYNGASYAKRGYHTRMAKAYQKFKQQQ